MASKNTKGNSVLVKTFKKWEVEHVIGNTVNDGLVTKVWCKLCAKHSLKIRSEVRGQAACDIDQYITGTNYVSKHTIQRHLHSKVHATAEELERLQHGSLASSTSHSHAGTLEMLQQNCQKIKRFLKNLNL